MEKENQYYKTEKEYENTQQGAKEADSFDQPFKRAFDKFQKAPAPEVWESMRSRLPLHLRLRSHLLVLSRLAAVLIGFMCLTLMLNRSTSSKGLHSDQAAHSAVLSKEQGSYPAKHFVNDLADPNLAAKTTALAKAKKNRKTGDEDLLLELILAEDEFDELATTPAMQEALLPSKPLPVGTARVQFSGPAMHEFTGPQQGEELRIMIPLRVVEKEEVDHLIELYQQSKQ